MSNAKASASILVRKGVLLWVFIRKFPLASFIAAAVPDLL
jgi:hypothetical protein